MQISVAAWQGIRPPSYKGGETERLITTFLQIRDSLNPAVAVENMAICERLLADLGQRAARAALGDFCSEAEQRKWEEGRSLGRPVAADSPRAQGMARMEQFTQTLARWCAEVSRVLAERQEKLVAGEQLLRGALTEVADRLLGEATLTYKGKILTPLQALRAQIAATQRAYDRRTLAQSAGTMLEKLAGPYRRLREGPGFEEAMQEHCKKVFGFTVDPAFLPKGTWRADLVALHAMAKSEVEALAQLAAA